jgi:DNA-binding transcriptional ArsR family regulator
MAEQVVTSRVELRLGDPRRLAISVFSAPHVTVLNLLTDAVGGMRRGLPDRLRRAVARAVRPQAYPAIRPIVHPGASIAPDCITRTPRGDVSMAEQVEGLRDTDGAEVLAELAAEFGDGVPEHWRAVERAPRRWLLAYAQATADAWNAFSPVWGQGRELLSREFERVGTALVRGGTDVLLASLHPRLGYQDGALVMDDPEPAVFELGDRRLVLVPTMGAPNAMVANFDLPDIVWISYPVPRLASLWTDLGPPGTAGRPEDALALLLGGQRSALLRLVSAPTPVGRLATELGVVPGAVTYQCDRLAAAGLITRERHGREMLVRRTERGSALLDLFSD